MSLSRTKGFGYRQAMERNGAQLVCLMLALLLAGCGATRLDEADWKKRTAALASEGLVVAPLEHPVDASQGPASAPLLTGTRANFVIERGPKDGRKERWDVSLDGPSHPRKRGGLNVTVSFEGATEDGTPIVERRKTYGYPGVIRVASNGGSSESGEANFPLGLMQEGLLDSCAVIAETPNPESFDDERRVQYFKRCAAHLFPLLAMSQVANNTPTIRKLLLETVQFPSWWSLLTLSIDVQPSVEIVDAKPVTTAHGDGYQVPFELLINGDAAFYATMTVVQPTGALILSSGIIALDGFAPHRPEETLSLRFTGSEQLPTDGSPVPIVAGYLISEE